MAIKFITQLKPPRANGHKIHHIIKPQSVISFKCILIMKAYCTTKPWNNGKHRQHYRKGNCFPIPTRPNTCNSFYKLSRKIVKIDHGPIPFLADPHGEDIFLADFCLPAGLVGVLLSYSCCLSTTLMAA